MGKLSELMEVSDELNRKREMFYQSLDRTFPGAFADIIQWKVSQAVRMRSSQTRERAARSEMAR